MTYVYGMAKSSISLRTAGPKRNLELDVLRIIYFLSIHNNKKENSAGFLLVYDEHIKTLIQSWIEKYNYTKDNIIILTFKDKISDLEKEIINNEKQNNKNHNDSIARLSQDITEKILVSEIEKRYVKFNDYEVENETKINWDFYKIYK